MRPSNGPGSGPYWDGSRPRHGLVHGFLHNLCTAVTSCFYVFCCCWLMEDCFMGRRSFPGHHFGPPDRPPPDIGPRPYGLLGSIMGGPQGPPPPPVVGHQHHGLLGSAVGGPPGPPSQPGPFGYPGEPAPYG